MMNEQKLRREKRTEVPEIAASATAGTKDKTPQRLHVETQNQEMSALWQFRAPPRVQGKVPRRNLFIELFRKDVDIVSQDVRPTSHQIKLRQHLFAKSASRSDPTSRRDWMH